MAKLKEMKAKREKLVAQRNDLDVKINDLTEKIEKEELQDKANKYDNIEIVLGESNVDIDKLVKAIEMKDTKAIELMLNNQRNSEEGSL